MATRRETVNQLLTTIHYLAGKVKDYSNADAVHHLGEAINSMSDAAVKLIEAQTASKRSVLEEDD